MVECGSIESRGTKLFQATQTAAGLIGMVLKMLDLQDELSATHEDLCEVNDELQATKEALQAAQNEARAGSASVELPDSIEISEFATPDGFLSNPPGEKTWIETLRHKTKMDVRAILSELPTEIGLYTFSFVYKRIDKLLHARVKVRVVPVAEGN
jgi:hypothetical protein